MPGSARKGAIAAIQPSLCTEREDYSSTTIVVMTGLRR